MTTTDGDRGIHPPPCVDRASCTGYTPPPCGTFAGSIGNCTPVVTVEQVPVDSPVALALLVVGVAAVAAKWWRR